MTVPSVAIVTVVVIHVVDDSTEVADPVGLITVVVAGAVVFAVIMPSTVLLLFSANVAVPKEMNTIGTIRVLRK